MGAQLKVRDPSVVARARERLTPPHWEKDVARVQQVVCEPARLKIVQALTAGPLCVEDIAIVIERARPATSQHLRVLREHGVVEGTRRGTIVYYRLRPGRVAHQVRAVVTALQPSEAPPA